MISLTFVSIFGDCNKRFIARHSIRLIHGSGINHSSLFHQLFISYSMGLVVAEAFSFVLFVFAESAFKPIDLRVALKGENVGTYPVEKPTVVGDDNGATGKVVEGFLQGAERVHV